MQSALPRESLSVFDTFSMFIHLAKKKDLSTFENSKKTVTLSDPSNIGMENPLLSW